MYGKIKNELKSELEEIHSAGLYKSERVIETAQAARVLVGKDSPVLNLCSNNYLGLANHPKVVKAARDALDKWGYGLASVRFICGTQSLHKELEARLSAFLGMEDVILYSSCFDANTGLFETILNKEDAVVSDALNHASIIDGVRLCKAARFLLHVIRASLHLVWVAPSILASLIPRLSMPGLRCPQSIPILSLEFYMTCKSRVPMKVLMPLSGD